jgi:DNA-directed RNA polymerase subunit E'/Rpb7
MFMPIRFKTNIELAPHELGPEIQKKILDKLKKKLEGLCSRHGYIKPGSLEIIQRSAGKFVKQHFNGHIHYDMICKGEVCNPPNGLIIQSQVKNKNALGLLAEGIIEINREKIPILDIIIPKKAAGIMSEVDIDSIEIGDIINVMVMGKRFQLNDTKISIIGRAVKDITDTTKIEELDETDTGLVNEEVIESDVELSGDEDDEDTKGGESDEDIGLMNKTTIQEMKKSLLIETDDLEEIEEEIEEDDHGSEYDEESAPYVEDD